MQLRMMDIYRIARRCVTEDNTHKTSFRSVYNSLALNNINNWNNVKFFFRILE
jgi:hypothetical protein